MNDNNVIARNGWWLVSLALAAVVGLLGWDHVRRAESDDRVRGVLTQLCEVRTAQAQAVMNYADRERMIERGNKFIDNAVREQRVANADQLQRDLLASQQRVGCQSIGTASAPAAVR